jgi:hypothetical protein
MAILNLMTAIYWGQLSGCKLIHGQLAGYTCKNRSAYGAVCAFAVFLFLFQLAFTVALSWWRDEFIVETASYEDLPPASSHSVNFTYAAPPMQSVAPAQQKYAAPPATSADL